MAFLRSSNDDLITFHDYEGRDFYHDLYQLQHEITELEKALGKLDKQGDANPEIQYRLGITKHEEGWDTIRWHLLRQIEVKLLEYDKLLRLERHRRRRKWRERSRLWSEEYKRFSDLGSHDLAEIEELREFVQPIESAIFGAIKDLEKHDFRSSKCNRCSTRVSKSHYACKLCLNGNYVLCQSCADKGFLCNNEGHTLTKRTIDLARRRIVNEEAYTPARGIKVDVYGKTYSVIGDSGSDVTVISEERRRELNLEMIKKRSRIKMGNSKKLVSQGTVELPLEFPHTPGKILTAVAHVVRDFTFDILLGRSFLNIFINHFVPCLFPSRNLWAFYSLGKTTQRFEATMGDGIPFLGLADTGSRRNIMQEDWALQHGFTIQSKPCNLGWIMFPCGPDEATTGQVHTSIALPDGRIEDTVFEVLPSCKLPVVLGVDFVVDNDIYNNYPEAFRDIDTAQERDGILGMGYRPWYTKVVDAGLRKVRRRAQPNYQQVEIPSVNEDTELTRQLEWNSKYDSGKLAPVEEWNAERVRRNEHERLRYPNAQQDPEACLIPYAPKTLALASDSHPSATGSSQDTESPSLNGSSQRPVDREGIDDQDSGPPIDVPTTNLTRSTSFGRDEALQWQREILEFGS